ncbi:replication initiator protein [Microviridae sp.]|nr:replication initiator protein [Microviridae sp.]
MCLFPVRAELQEFGKPKLDPEGSIHLPCGKCYECKSKRAFDWAFRCSHEIALHEDNTFITLTYDDEHLPSFLVVKDEFQKFMKKLRKKVKKKIKYIVSHEYGSRTGRPHHHAIIFGWVPPNQSYLSKAPSGESLFTSPDLDELWKHGFHSIGEANEKTAYYIASYALKSHSHDVIDPDTNEVVTVSDSMDSSRRPAIGRDYFLANMHQIVHSGDPLPRYYLKLMEKISLLEDKEHEFFHLKQKSLDLLCDYETLLYEKNIKQRNTHNLFAKYVITEQRENESSDGLRTAPRKKKESSIYKQHLRWERDRSQSIKKGEIR